MHEYKVWRKTYISKAILQRRFGGLLHSIYRVRGSKQPSHETCCSFDMLLLRHGWLVKYLCLVSHRKYFHADGIAAIVTIGQGVITNYGGLLALRFLLGSFEAGLVPGTHIL